MRPLNIAILGCGTVGGGVAKILTEQKELLSKRAGREINLKVIAELNPPAAISRFNLDKKYFAGGGDTVSREDASKNIQNILEAEDIDVVVETMGGKGNFVHDTCLGVLQHGKNLVTANKALLAERGADIFKEAEDKKLQLGYEAAVCGAIPIIKGIKECFTGDIINSVCGIFNGTSNYILTQMQNKGLDFSEALKLAQKEGYAEADPTLDINGGDASHKLILLIKLAFGMEVTMDQLSITGIQNITKNDMDFAREINSSIKLICMARRENNQIFAEVRPMAVKNDNTLSSVNYAVNAVRLDNKYSDTHFFIGKGAGSSETAMSIVSDIVFIARHGDVETYNEKNNLVLGDSKKIAFPYLVSFKTKNLPGTTGLIATEIGKQGINIETVSHNRFSGETADFSVETESCEFDKIEKAIAEIKKINNDLLLEDPKILPILY
ncbi:MAG: homoserine dehydrogenase [Bacteroidales bacterium]|nr:homoserine dehydrogenase [Bacteroidales bacterium]